ncbi:MAG: hypothetical protein K2F83_06295 [Oscillospiraceae bacterium]|nr:hypothetical protein [Oscillospiraceae bacterium]
MASITVEAPAKLNLALDVLGKREDGYHEMKMVMQSVSLFDTLTLTHEPGEGMSLSYYTQLRSNDTSIKL